MWLFSLHTGKTPYAAVPSEEASVKSDHRETTYPGLTVGKTRPGHALYGSTCHAESTNPRGTWKRVPRRARLSGQRV